MPPEPPVLSPPTPLPAWPPLPPLRLDGFPPPPQPAAIAATAMRLNTNPLRTAVRLKIISAIS
jgi:hypothetical protein